MEKVEEQSRGESIGEAKEVLSWSTEHFFVYYYICCEVNSIRVAFRRLNFVLLKGLWFN